MTDHFDIWINGMSEEEYGEMYENDNPWGFSDAQKDVAINIRTPPTPQDELNLNEAQSGGDYTETVTQPSVVSSESPIDVRPIQPELDARPVEQYTPTDYTQEPLEGSSESPTEAQEYQTSQPTPSYPIRQPVRPQRLPSRVEPVPEKQNSNAGERVRSIGRFFRRFFGG